MEDLTSKLQYLIGELGYKCLMTNAPYKSANFQKLIELSINLNYTFYKITEDE